jgi:two-component system, NtrC family, nitrogen regulation sensor histidine kinase NtrY
LAIALLAFAMFGFQSEIFHQSGHKITRDFSGKFHQKEQSLNLLLTDFAQKVKSHDHVQLFDLEKFTNPKLFQEEGFLIYAFDADRMIFWSHNSVPLLNYVTLSNLEEGFVQLQNGWYRILLKKQDDITIAGLMLIKQNFPHQNQFLQNSFQKDFSVPDEVGLSLDSTFSEHHISDFNGDFLFALVLSGDSFPIPLKKPFSIFLFVVGFIFLLAFLQSELKRIFHFSLFGMFVFASILLLIRLLLFVDVVFPLLHQLNLFNPSFYATSAISPSLGDLLINSFFTFYLLYVFNSRCKIGQPALDKMSVRFKQTSVFFALLLLFLFGVQIIFWFNGLILDSRINFNLTNVFNIDYFGLTGFIIAVLLLFSFYLLADKILFLSKRMGLGGNNILKLAIFPYLFSVLLLFFILNDYNPFNYLWHLPILFTIWHLRKTDKHNYTFSRVLLVVLIFSALTSYNFNHFALQREQQNRIITIERLAQERDPIAEFLFAGIEDTLQEDSVLKKLVSKAWQQKSLIENHLLSNYFNGYWSRYDFQVTICSPMDSIIIPAEKVQLNCYSFFDNILGQFGQPTNGKYFYFLNNQSGRISYLAQIPIVTDDEESILFIEADSKFLPEGSGYPELLMDASEIMQSPEMLNYSFAKFKNGRLVSKSEIYNYSVSLEEFQKENENLYFLNYEGFSHLIYKPDTSTAIVLSTPVFGFQDHLTSFSYVFAFFSLLLLLILFFRNVPSSGNIFSLDFKTKIQIILVGTVVFSILLFGFWTASFLKNQYSVKNKRHITEKTNSVLIELEHKLAAAPVLDAEIQPYLSELLVKFSDVFFTDINLYSSNGNLVSSSQEEIFVLGLSGRKMNPEAFRQMAIHQKTSFIQREKIGKLEYISSYVPIYNLNGDLLAYLNLPYFAKQNELEKELASFLVSLVNIYVLLFTFSVIIALLLSNIITGPLQLIRNKLSDVKLGKSNELIDWNGKDEIGSLVNEYNRMIIALSESAEMLAKSERESAWREMAKQVAHEIKNPLTPMKLSIQHLERAKKDNAPEFDQILERFTKTLVEQIDALANIANEFSNFAKMPVSNPEVIDIKALLKNVLSLFSGSTEAEIIVNSPSDTNLMVIADREQLLRVFNNLLKNAIQSIPYGQEGLVQITLKSDKNMLLVSIKDNGIGIEKEQLKNIFVPNFTTKTGGSGLGLAMVKSIIESSGGNITFNSQVGKGTEFIFSLPLMTDV